MKRTPPLLIEIFYMPWAGGSLVDYITCLHNSNCPYRYPENVKQNIGNIPFENGTPRECKSIDGVNYPNEEKWARRAQPTDQAKTENAKEHANQLHGAKMLDDKSIDCSEIHQDNQRQAGLPRLNAKAE